MNKQKYYQKKYKCLHGIYNMTNTIPTIIFEESLLFPTYLFKKQSDDKKDIFYLRNCFSCHYKYLFNKIHYFLPTICFSFFITKFNCIYPKIEILSLSMFLRNIYINSHMIQSIIFFFLMLLHLSLSSK